jgi:hypothetical protein
MRYNSVPQAENTSEFEMLSYIRYTLIYPISLPTESKANGIRVDFSAHTWNFVTYL